MDPEGNYTRGLRLDFAKGGNAGSSVQLKRPHPYAQQQAQQAPAGLGHLVRSVLQTSFVLFLKRVRLPA